MTRKIVALATAAAISLATFAPAVSAMETEFNMLTGAVYNALRSFDLPTDNIENLTLAQIATIKGILDGDDGGGNKKLQIKAILER